MSTTPTDVLDAFVAFMGSNREEPAEFLLGMLDAVYASDGSLDEARVLADWLQDNDHPEAAAVLALVSPSSVREVFRHCMTQEMTGAVVWWARGITTRLGRANREICWRVLRDCFRWYMDRRATDAVNDFTRQKLREEGFHRRIMPPLAITNDELDRAIDTDLPVAVVDSHESKGEW